MQHPQLLPEPQLLPQPPQQHRIRISIIIQEQLPQPELQLHIRVASLKSFHGILCAWAKRCYMFIRMSLDINGIFIFQTAQDNDIE